MENTNLRQGFGQQACTQCSATFDITDDDLALLEKVSPVIGGKSFPLPPPTHCFSCRNRRRWARRNHRKLYKRRSEPEGTEVVSLYSADKPFTVYKEDYWYGDKWDPLDYGRPYDPDRPFFEQFADLQQAVPRSAMNQDGTNENCEYVTFGSGNKNCYLAFTCMYCQDVYYSTTVGMCKNCMDCYKCVQSELLYQCVECTNCYNCIHCQDSFNCQDSLFLDDCRDCHHCISCKNLHHKSYHIENRPVSREEFASEKARLLSGNLRDTFAAFQAWKLQYPHPFARISQSEDSTGDYLDQAKHCIDCFEIAMGAEDARHCHFAGMQCKDMMDCTMAGEGSELLYEMVGVSACQRCMSVCFGRSCTNSYYCDVVQSCAHCFGCVGLRHKKYCILNTQYTEEEYNELVPKIIEKMTADGEWGEFFPIKISPFCYNETIASEQYPLSKEEALQQSYAWKEDDANSPQPATFAGSPVIGDVPDSVTKELLACEECDKNFRIIPQELAAYRNQGLPLPAQCPECRHRQRLLLKNPPRLWERSCQKCGKNVQSSYAPDRPQTVYCKECYLAEVY